MRCLFWERDKRHDTTSEKNTFKDKYLYLKAFFSNEGSYLLSPSWKRRINSPGEKTEWSAAFLIHPSPSNLKWLVWAIFLLQTMLFSPITQVRIPAVVRCLGTPDPKLDLSQRHHESKEVQYKYVPARKGQLTLSTFRSCGFSCFSVSFRSPQSGSSLSFFHLAYFFFFNMARKSMPLASESK